MAKSFEIQVVFVFCLTLSIYTVLSEVTHVFINDSKYESFVHNLKETYFLDKNETIEVWAHVVPFPWEDNRLMPGISDAFLLEFNATCVEQVVSQGVVTRNMTVEISQVPRDANKSSTEDKTGNATFHIAIFEETENDNLRVETEIIVGCPPGRNITHHSPVKYCPAFDNYTFTIPSGHYRSDFITPFSQATTPKTVHYDLASLGCPLEANYYETFKPKLQLRENGKFLRNVTANYVLFELNGRTDYSFFATMAEVGCHREAQTYQKMIDSNQDLSDVSLAWTSQNYQSCFDHVPNENLDQPYEILNLTGLSALTWRSEGVYVFKATVIDPEYSFCNLTAVFGVHVSGIESEHEELVPFIVLGTSVFGLLSIIFLVFVTSK